MKFEIHVSDLRTFKQCRRKWNWSSPLRRNLEPEIPYMPFFTGRAIHYCLERYHGYNERLDMSLQRYMKQEREMMERVGKLWPQEEALIAEQVVLIAGMLKHYGQWTKRDLSKWSDNKLEFLQLETEFSVPLRNPKGNKSNRVFLAGRFDGLVRHRENETYWLWETKTTRSIRELARSLENDEQCGTYLIAAQEVFGVRISGVLYNILRKKAPTQPQVLRDGTLTKRSNLDSTAYAYIEAAQDLHRAEFPGDEKSLNAYILEEYKDAIQNLLDKGNTFFSRFPVYRTQKELEQLQLELWTVALEMVRPSTVLYPTPGWMNCNFCHFKSPCLMLNAGGDYEFILEQEYRQREPWQMFEEANNVSDA